MAGFIVVDVSELIVLNIILSIASGIAWHPWFEALRPVRFCRCSRGDGDCAAAEMALTTAPDGCQSIRRLDLAKQDS
jgi:hypothetical protein